MGLSTGLGLAGSMLSNSKSRKAADRGVQAAQQAQNVSIRGLGSIQNGVVDVDRGVLGARRGFRTIRDQILESLPGLIEGGASVAGNDVTQRLNALAAPRDQAALEALRSQLIGRGTLGVGSGALGGANPELLALLQAQQAGQLNRDLQGFDATQNLITGNLQNAIGASNEFQDISETGLRMLMGARGDPGAMRDALAQRSAAGQRSANATESFFGGLLDDGGGDDILGSIFSGGSRGFRNPFATNLGAQFASTGFGF